METKKQLNELTTRLNKIRQELSNLPEKREDLESTFNELEDNWPTMLAREAIGELSEEQLSEFRRELAVADRNRRELAELEEGLLSLEKQVMNEMRPLQRKMQKAEREKQYETLKAKIEAGNYDMDEIGTFRQVAHELNHDKECSELLQQLDYQRNREMSFGQVHGLQAQPK